MNHKIKSFNTALLMLLWVMIIISGCKKNNPVGSEPGNLISPRPAGEPVSDGVFQWVGTEGGTIISEDGRLTITIPEGALSQETEIVIQPLANTSLSGIGYAYRLTPHGNVFNKEVTISFSYKHAEQFLSNNEAVEIAWQNDEGKWICYGDAINDKVSKTIRVNTNHFSDWNLIASMELTPVVKTIGLSESVSLKAFRYVHPVNDEDFIVPLSIPNVGSGEPMLIENRYIVKWTLNGPGQLQASGSQATYTAPSSMPADNSATVTLELNVNGKQVLLISTIHLIEDGIQLSIDGGPWQTYAGMATKVPDMDVFTLANLRVSADLPQIVMMWPFIPGKKADGNYPWSMLGNESSDVVFEYATPSLDKIYVSVYENANGDVYDSPGFLSVEEIDYKGRKYLSGMFALDRSGLFNNGTSEQESIVSIIGTFRVQRNW